MTQKQLTTRLHRHWSESKLRLLEQCPLAFRFCYIDRIPVPPGVEKVYGGIIHLFLKRFFRLKNGYKSPETFANAFVGYWRGVLSGKHGPDGYYSPPVQVRFRRQKTRDERDIYIGAGVNLLKRFYQDNWCYRDGREPMPTLVEKKHFVKWQGHQITGVIDRIQPYDEGKLAVIDYKTDQYRSRSEVEIKYDLQFTFYSLIFYLKFGRFPDEMELWFLNGEGTNKVGLPQRSLSDFVELKGKIEEAERFVQGALHPTNAHCLLAERTFHYFCLPPMKTPHFYRISGPHCRTCDYDHLCIEHTVDDPYRSMLVTRQMADYKPNPETVQLKLEGLEFKRVRRKKTKDA